MSTSSPEASVYRQAPALRTLLRCMGYLKPYWQYVAGAYFLLLLTNGITLAMPLIIQYIIDTGIRAGDVTAIGKGSIA
ncbi:MAG TPA: hypothetical protein VGK87_03755, partial [Anaerolineae bacterium]